MARDAAKNVAKGRGTSIEKIIDGITRCEIPLLNTLITVCDLFYFIFFFFFQNNIDEAFNSRHGY